MNPATILLYPFDWRGVLSRAAYRRNLTILVLTGALIKRLDLLPAGASLGWTLLAAAIGLSFDARRYHDIGWSAAWIAWANLIGVLLAIVAFQFIPNALDYIPLPADWRLDAAGRAVFGRFVLPALVGVIIGNIAQSMWLATAPTLAGDNRYARQTATRRGPAADRDDEGPDEADLQAMIDRRLAERQIEMLKPAPSPQTPGQTQTSAAFPQNARQFGRRGR
jgi:uncharacterized membrane protein YhaH (DUF805 family)